MLHIEQEQIQKRLFRGKFGLEKEHLRVTRDGFLAQTPHPFPGNAHIVRDFGENQIEINTPVCDTAEEALGSLGAYTREIQEALASLPEPELLWPFSNPPYIRGEEDIPIARYEGAEAGKTAYREHLSRKYGRYMMTFCGIHVNYSFDEELLRAEFDYLKTIHASAENTLNHTNSFQDYKNHFYLELAKKAAAYSWILTAVTAASPVVDSSFFEKGRQGESAFAGMGSMRGSELGYWNCFTPVMNYSDMQAHVKSIQGYVEKGFIAAPSELYYPVRLKPVGAYQLTSLLEGGADHIELRMFDLNPFCEEGIDLRDLYFSQLLLIYLASIPDIEISSADQLQAAHNFKQAAHYNLEAVHIMLPGGQVFHADVAGQKVIHDMKEFYKEYPGEIQEVLDFQMEKFLKPETRYAHRVKKMLGEKYVEKGFQIAEKNREYISEHA